MPLPRSASSCSSSVIAALAALAVAASSCSIPTQTSTDPIGDLPTSQSFINDGVSLFMERRCGGLDCHGQVGRPLRLYSEWGLRLKAEKDGSRSTKPTTDEERIENYRAVVGLEPENMAKCFASQGANVDTFQLLKKPLDISGLGIRHKGGPVLRAKESDSGWQCLFGWASGKVDPADCKEAAQLVK